MAKPITNTKLIKNLLDLHPMMEVFVIESINQYANAVKQDNPIKGGLINPEMWAQLADVSINAINSRNN